MTAQTSDTTFSPVGCRGRYQCDVCGARGFAPEDCRWAEPHKRGHTPCPSCGRMLTVRKDGSPRTHARCPGRRHREVAR